MSAKISINPYKTINSKYKRNIVQFYSRTSIPENESPSKNLVYKNHLDNKNPIQDNQFQNSSSKNSDSVIEIISRKYLNEIYKKFQASNSKIYDNINSYNKSTESEKELKLNNEDLSTSDQNHDLVSNITKCDYRINQRMSPIPKSFEKFLYSKKIDLFEEVRNYSISPMRDEIMNGLRKNENSSTENKIQKHISYKNEIQNKIGFLNIYPLSNLIMQFTSNS